MIEKKLHYHKYLRLWFNWLMTIQNIFKQIAYESIHVLTISVKLQLGYVNQNKRIEKLCGTVITSTLKHHLNSESKLNAPKPTRGSSQL